MRETCPLTNETCKYFTRQTPSELRDKQEHGCFADTAHPYHPKSVVAKIGATAMNNALKFQQCRREHDDYHATVPFNLPTHTELKEWKEARRGPTNGRQD